MLSEFNDGAFAPCPAPFNLAAYVLEAGLETPGKDALLIVGQKTTESWTYQRLRTAVLGTATGLLRAGLVPGDIVLMRLGNTVDFPIAYLGALAAGLVPVPTSSALTGPEVEFAVETVRPRLVLCAPGVPCPENGDLVQLAELRSWRNLPQATIHAGDPDRLGYIVFTSGTAGTPRAVAHAHRAIWARQMMFEDWYALRASDRVMHAGAFNWTFTLGTGLLDPWTKGATALVPAADTSAKQLPDLIAQHEATIFAAAPGVYRKMLDGVTDAFDMPHLRHGLSAGEKLPETTAQRWRSLSRRPVYEAYGMSECSTFISQSPRLACAPGSLGRPQKGRRIAILKDGTRVKVGDEGTLAIHRSDCGLMLGYLNAPAASADKFCGDWFMTGDLATMNEEFDVFYAGRTDDMMNAGGFRVSPLEVEAVLAQCPGIDSVAVTAVQVKQDTDVIAAFYTAPRPLDETDARDYVASKLARYKQPRLYVHMPKLPTGANGKILRRALRASFERPE